jgi:hypothetical protein
MTTAHNMRHIWPPLMAGMLGLPCRPYSGPRQLIVGGYYFVVEIMGTYYASQAIPRLFYVFFALDLSGNCPGDLNPALRPLRVGIAPL